MFLEFIRRLISQVTSLILTLAGDLFSIIHNLKLIKRLPKQPLKFVKKYSMQLSFGFILIIFLMMSVGEGQAYQVGAADFSTDINLPSSGFLGKPQILGAQTILTGEVQQIAVINYTVEKGDTISTIASRYNLSVGSLLDANGMKAIDAEKIKIGSQLVIPAEDTNSSLAWLEEINTEKARQRALAEAARRRELARQTQRRRASGSRISTSYSGDYEIIGKMYGSYNGGLPGWCTWYANYKRPDLPDGLGNAKDYIRNARAKGLATGKIARPGAIFVSNESSYGHNGYVESVNGDTMTVSEMNYVGRYIVSRRTVPTSLAWGFIY